MGRQFLFHLILFFLDFSLARRRFRRAAVNREAPVPRATRENVVNVFFNSKAASYGAARTNYAEKIQEVRIAGVESELSTACAMIIIMALTAR